MCVMALQFECALLEAGFVTCKNDLWFIAGICHPPPLWQLVLWCMGISDWMELLQV